MRLASVYPLVSSRAVARPFTYEVPDGVGKGAVVSIRFGRSAARGVVVETGVEAPAGVKPAPIDSVLYELPPALVDLALWVADYYGSTPARALELVAPKLRVRRGERRMTGAGMAGEAEPDELTEPQQRRSRGSWRRSTGTARTCSSRGADGQRQDRGLPPGVRCGARARPRRDRARPRDRADAADARPLPGALRRPDRRPALGADRGGAARRAGADRRRRGAGRRRRPLGGLRSGAEPRPDLRRRGARLLVQAGVRPPLRRAHGGGQAGRTRGRGRRLRQRDAAARELGGARAARAGIAGSAPRCRRSRSSTCAARRAIRSRRRCWPSWAGSPSTAARRSSSSTGAGSRPRSTAAPAGSPAGAVSATSR